MWGALLLPEAAHPSRDDPSQPSCTMLHITHRSALADPAAPRTDAVMGWPNPRPGPCFVLYIMINCFISASIAAPTSSPRLDFLGFYMLDHLVEVPS